MHEKFDLSDLPWTYTEKKKPLTAEIKAVC